MLVGTAKGTEDLGMMGGFEDGWWGGGGPPEEQNRTPLIWGL